MTGSTSSVDIGHFIARMRGAVRNRKVNLLSANSSQELGSIEVERDEKMRLNGLESLARNDPRDSTAPALD